MVKAMKYNVRYTNKNGETLFDQNFSRITDIVEPLSHVLPTINLRRIRILKNDKRPNDSLKNFLIITDLVPKKKSKPLLNESNSIDSIDNLPDLKPVCDVCGECMRS